MRAIIFLFLFLSALADTLVASPLDVSWARQIGGTEFELGYGADTDADGNVYVTGYFHSPTLAIGSLTLTNSSPTGTNANAYVAKLNPAGDVLWARAAGGATESSSIAVDAAGNSYIAGRYLSPMATFGNITLTNGGTTLPIEIFAAKYDTDGNVLWAQSAGGPGNDTGFAVAADDSGNCYVTGWFRDAPAKFGNFTLNNTGSFNWFVAKYDAAGTVLWVRANAGNGDTQSKGIGVDGQGNVYVAGRFGGTTSFGSGPLSAAHYDFVLVKYSASGTLIWVRSAGGSGLDYGSGVAVDAAGNAYVTGYFESPSMTMGGMGLTNAGVSGVPEIFTAKYDSNGTVLWVRAAHGVSGDEGRGIALDAYGNPCVTGFFNSDSLQLGSLTINNTGGSGSSDAFILKYDPHGNLMAANSFGGSANDAGRSVAADSSGNIYLAGSFLEFASFGQTNLSAIGSADGFLVKVSTANIPPAPVSAPEFLWARSAGSVDSDTQGGIAVDALGNVYASGHFTSSISFGSTNLVSRGDTDVYVAKYDFNGGLLWVRQMGGTATDSSPTVALDHANCVYVSGYFTGTATFGNTTLTAAGQEDIYIAKYDSNGTFLWAKKAGGTGSDQCINLEVDRANAFFLGGYFRNIGAFGTNTVVANNSCTAGRSDAYVAKYDSEGNSIWAISGGSCENDVTYDVAVDPSGDVYAVGYFRDDAVFSGQSLGHIGEQDAFIAKYNGNGQIQWIRSGVGSGIDIAQTACADAFGNVYVTGEFTSNPLTFGATNLFNAGGRDILFAKYNSVGALVWVRSIGSTLQESNGAVFVDGAGDILVAGFFQGTASFGSTNLTSQGGSDMFLAKYNPDGTLLWVKGWGTSGTDGASDIALDNWGGLYMAGIFSGNLTLGNDSLTSAGSSDVYVGKLGTFVPPVGPTLNVARSGNNLLISWPSSFAGYVLQEAITLGASWTQVAAAPVIFGETYVTAVTISGGSRMFRLAKP